MLDVLREDEGSCNEDNMKPISLWLGENESKIELQLFPVHQATNFCLFGRNTESLSQINNINIPKEDTVKLH